MEDWTLIFVNLNQTGDTLEHFDEPRKGDNTESTRKTTYYRFHVIDPQRNRG